MSEKATVSVTTDQLKDLFTSVIAEVKKPTALEQKELDRQEEELQDRQIARKNLAAQMVQNENNKQAFQRICSHKHAKGGQSHGVYIEKDNYILCQRCQATIRPGTAPENYKGYDIYDNDLFNRVFQDLSAAEVF